MQEARYDPDCGDYPNVFTLSLSNAIDGPSTQVHEYSLATTATIS